MVANTSRRWASLILLGALLGTGCSTTSNWVSDDDENEGPRRWSDEWYAMKADSPVGARQVYRKGKLWPPYPRPTGEQQEMSHRFHAAHYWPFPYICDDRQSVNNVTQLQVNNGWTNQTTLWSHHFDENNALNKAGRLYLEWILNYAPEQYRAVWIQKSSNPETNQLRMASVQTTAAEILGNGVAPPTIALRTAEATGRPALEIDSIRKAELGSMPPPRVAYEALQQTEAGQ